MPFRSRVKGWLSHGEINARPTGTEAEAGSHVTPPGALGVASQTPAPSKTSSTLVGLCTGEHLSEQSQSSVASSVPPIFPNQALPGAPPTTEADQTVVLNPNTNASAGPADVANRWARAYHQFAEKEPDLATDYQRHIAAQYPDVAVNESILLNPESVKSVIQHLLDDRDKKQWRLSLLGRDVKVREQAEKLAKFLLWSDSIVKDALSAQPYAALAWSGVSMVLPVCVCLPNSRPLLTGAASRQRFDATRGNA